MSHIKTLYTYRVAEDLKKNVIQVFGISFKIFKSTSFLVHFYYSNNLKVKTILKFIKKHCNATLNVFLNTTFNKYKKYF